MGRNGGRGSASPQEMLTIPQPTLLPNITYFLAGKMEKEEILSPGKIEVGASHLPPTALTKADFYADKIRDHLI